MKKKGKSSRKKKRSAFTLRLWRFLWRPAGKVLLAFAMTVAIVCGLVVNHYYWTYAKLIDAKLSRGPFNRTSKILAAPDSVFLGEEMTPEGLLSLLRAAGYSESRHNRVGHYLVKTDAVEIYPGALSYFRQEPAVLYFEQGRISRIVSLNDNMPRTVYELEPKLITNLFDRERSKRRLVLYEDIPAYVRNAVLSIEDHRFFDHIGIDFLRTAKAAWDGFNEGRRPRGTSTLTQQLSRGFFLTPEQTYTRKLAELMIAFQLERRLSKEKIFEHYINLVPLGRRGSFNVMGIGEAGRAYFDKDIRELTISEAALLAGLIQRPSFLHPYRHPERARNRRNQVLSAMLRYGHISEDEFQEAVNEQVILAQGNVESSTAPYFVDLVNRLLRESFGEEELITQSYWVYTTLDLNLQKAAMEAVEIGMAEVEERVARQRRFRGAEPPRVECAMVVLEPSTGEVKAIVGGRNYGLSQLNRVLANRQPGSAFKPFVYAAAIETALREDAPQILTALSPIDDVPTTFWHDEKPYQPANFSNRIYGVVTLRQALAKSLNIATVKIAEITGYDRVAEMAERLGIGKGVKPTPSIALGAYEVTPLDIAGAYTALANGGVKMKPFFVRSVRDSVGKPLLRNRPEGEQVLDPRVAYIVTNMLEDVIRRGTAVRVRGMGFRAPAAGKTGTDDDGWFVGYTSNLLAVVWVGFDDNTDLSIEGSKSALPIWTEFMKRAHELREYRKPAPFEPVEGIVSVQIDPLTQDLATYACPDKETEVFIAGSEPHRYCRVHGGGRSGTFLATNVAGWENGPPVVRLDPVGRPDDEAIAAAAETPTQPIGDPGAEPRSERPGKPKTRKGFFGRLFDVIR